MLHHHYNTHRFVLLRDETTSERQVMPPLLQIAKRGQQRRTKTSGTFCTFYSGASVGGKAAVLSETGAASRTLIGGIRAK